jgi:tetratricopeptide (TPR) repeat protein
MDCPRCGRTTPAHAGRCTACGAGLTSATVATGVIAIDTTGLPPGATFGASTGLHTHATAGESLTGLTGDLPASPDGNAGPLKVGQSFSARYHIIKLLGVGGMGAVYQAWDAELGVAVALKVIRVDRHHGTASSELEKRFKNELLLARQVTHKNVVRIHDLGEIDGIKYITMPYVEGDDLATVLRRDGKLPIARALRLARQIADGLGAAHDAGVVHRDLKPPNVMIGADDLALIMDFGISASTAEATSGGVIGTLEYMAPEQGSGKPVDARADIYAFGLILYEMLLGPRVRQPGSGQERVDAMKRRFEVGLPSARTVDPSIPESLDAIVTRCLGRDPAERYQSTSELCGELAAIDDAGELIPIQARVSKRMMVAAAALVVMLLGGTYFVGRRAAPVGPAAHDSVPVLIADFDNRTGDPAFEGSVEQSLAIALEGASFITVFKTADARSIAQQISPGKTGRITGDVGQLIARREGIKVMVAGAIDRRGTGFRLELTAMDPATGKPIATAGQNVRDKAQVLGAVASMATNIREALGESKTEMAKLTAAETVTAGSLDAMRAYARGQEFLNANHFQEALQEYQRAVDLDPNFGRAYAGMAVIYASYLKQLDKAEASYKAALNHLDRMTEREKYRTLGSYYMMIARNQEKAVENYEALVKAYPADNVGHGSLALAYMGMGDVARAVVEGRKSLEIYPKSAFLRYNYAMYSMYAGDFKTAIAEASRLLQENPSFEYPTLPLALPTLAQGDVAAARAAYARLSQVSVFGASLATQGNADLEMYFGRYRDAVRVLREGIAADATNRNTAEAVPQKYVALAEAYLALGQKGRAADAAREAAQRSGDVSSLFPAARVLIRAGQDAPALQVASDLEKMLQRQTTAYAGLIRGEIALQGGRVVEGIEALRGAQKRHDSWLGRFLLGKAYVEAGHYPEALAELELCLKRRGETTDVFFYDMPTLRYLPPLYYWLARAQEGVGASAAATKFYEQFLSLRAEADPPDPLAADARRRISSR